MRMGVKSLVLLFVFLVMGNGQTVEVVWKKALNVPPQKNCRIPKFSPDGRFISFEVRDNENAYLYLYEIATDTYVQLGKKDAGRRGGRFGLRSLLSTTFTGNITFWKDPEDGTLLFDFVHTPFFGQRYLYQADIGPNEGIQKFVNQPFSNSDIYYRFDNLASLQMVRNPAFTNGTVADIPWVAFSDRQNLYVFNHGEFDDPIQLTNPTGIWADMLPKFSPDDRTIAFIRDSRENTDIGLITLQKKGNRLAKKNEKLIIHGKSIDVSPEWSPNGLKIAYYSDEGHPRNFSIWIYDVVTGEKYPVVENVVPNSYRIQGPAWVGNTGIVFVRRDLKKGFPIFYYDIPRKKEVLVPTKTLNNLDVAVHPMQGNEYLMVFASGGATTGEEKFIWTKLFLAKIRIHE